MYWMGIEILVGASRKFEVMLLRYSCFSQLYRQTATNQPARLPLLARDVRRISELGGAPHWITPNRASAAHSITAHKFTRVESRKCSCVLGGVRHA